MSDILTCENLTVARGRKLIYRDFSISFGTGVTTILGPNGAGKTTLLEALVRPDRVKDGRVFLDSQEVFSDVQLPEFLERLGYMPQKWAFYRGFSVRDSLRYTAWLKRLPANDVEYAVDSSLAWVDLMDQRNEKIRRLSGGMRQRVGLAEAFVNAPRAVLLDEPTVGLDPAQRAMFRRFVRDRSEGRAVILSTHLTDDVEAMADRVVVIANGKLAFDGSPFELKKLGRAAEGFTALEAGYLSVIADPTIAEAS